MLVKEGYLDDRFAYPLMYTDALLRFLSVLCENMVTGVVIMNVIPLHRLCTLDASVININNADSLATVTRNTMKPYFMMLRSEPQD